ncbi:RpiB/LacA/LacB family sugar-phosphate isomerase [Streptomyces monomycini]|uniref:RpiB/LacA/LacB family sugar-phosphate isomerase n=1 Tax=Streptomyces monomycini TaxID=371720 RepID=UPI001EEA7451|nr:RpiB/LacA/LacB family sugar-phosphate isomerase [Streptomyces monomycini]
MERLRIVVGSDQAGHAYKEALAADLRSSVLVSSVTDVGVDTRGGAVYPEVAFAAAQMVAAGAADRGVLVCHTGLGVAIAANKVRGVRAVTAHDPLSIRHAVLHNNAQMLALGQGVVGLGLARELVRQWMTYRFDVTSSAAAKLALITDFENRPEGRQEDRHAH